MEQISHDDRLILQLIERLTRGENQAGYYAGNVGKIE